MKLDDRGLLVVISGPSGVGKGTVRSALFNMQGHDLVYSVSMTTRAPPEPAKSMELIITLLQKKNLKRGLRRISS